MLPCPAVRRKAFFLAPDCDCQVWVSDSSHHLGAAPQRCKGNEVPKGRDSQPFSSLSRSLQITSDPKPVEACKEVTRGHLVSVAEVRGEVGQF